MREKRKGPRVLYPLAALCLLLASACATLDEPLASGVEEPQPLRTVSITPLPDG